MEHLVANDRGRWVQWRVQRLRTAGFDLELAETLALERRVDLHQLLGLVDRGCPPTLAAQILAPIDAPIDGEPGAQRDGRS